VWEVQTPHPKVQEWRETGEESSRGNRFKVLKSRVMQCRVREVRRQEVVREEVKCFGYREKGHKK